MDDGDQHHPQPRRDDHQGIVRLLHWYKGMPSGTLTSVREYRATSYRPDREYVDGVLWERSMGERDHSELQTELAAWLNVRRRRLGIHVFVEQRIQVSPTRYRVPDICVTRGDRPTELVFTNPPFVCIEILSKDDRDSDLRERIEDYLRFGVSYCWVINPRSRRAWAHTRDGSMEVTDGMLRTDGPVIEVPLPEIFKELES